MTPTEAVSALRARVRAFGDIPSRIVELQRRANAVGKAAYDRGDTEAAEQSRETVRRLGDLLQIYRKVQAEWERLTRFVPGLGVVPIAYAGAVVAVASAVVWILSRVDAETEIVRMLEDGRLSTEEAERLLAQAEGQPGPFTPLAEAAKWVAYAIGGYILFNVWREHGGGAPRSW